MSVSSASASSSAGCPAAAGLAAATVSAATDGAGDEALALLVDIRDALRRLEARGDPPGTASGNVR